MMRTEQQLFADTIVKIYKFIDETISAKGKSFEFRWRKGFYRYDPPFTLKDKKAMDKMRDKIAKFLIRDAFNVLLKELPLQDDHHYEWDIGRAFNRISQLEFSKPIDYYALEKINPDEVKPVDLDEQGNPIKAKPLNMNSIYVQWQDESKFPRNKSFDDLMKTRLTEEEIETIESEAIQELKEMQ